jgi:mRNA-degrading endonuclease RelE of RelBE toxin-antitoxin system
MSKWTILITPDAMRELRSVAHGRAAELTEMISTLAVDPYPPDSEPAGRLESLYQVKRHNFHIIYDVLVAQHAIRIVAARSIE